MTTVRALDSNHDWTYGRGKASYKTGADALAQQIQCAVLSFLNDCFFDMSNGVDYWNLLGGKDLTALKFAISAQILNVSGVVKLVSINLSVDKNRNVSGSYTVQTVYSTVTGSINQQAAA